MLDDERMGRIAAGLAQRADLLERVMADLYGAGRLVARRHAAARAGRRQPGMAAGRWSACAPRSGHYLHFLAFEIGRAPDGSWFVLGDRTQAPSGAGFALENRIATARVFPTCSPTPMSTGSPASSAPSAMRCNGLRRSRRRPRRDPDPGPTTDTYFEHAYIARYLGFMLLEGEDLKVEGGRVMVRTVDGLSRSACSGGGSIRLRRSAGARRRLSARHARHGRGVARRAHVHGQRARLRRARDAGLPGLPAAHLPSI